jgi:TonB family protein
MQRVAAYVMQAALLWGSWIIASYSQRAPAYIASDGQTHDHSLIVDEKGCKLVNLRPHENEAVSWSGACENGLASGEGTLQWFLDGKPNGISTGTFRNGQLEGRGARIAANGDRIEGMFAAGRPDGRMLISYTGGKSFEVQFAKGERLSCSAEEYRFHLMRNALAYKNRVPHLDEAFENRVQGRAVVRLLVAGDNKTIELVESSGAASLDEQAVHMVRRGAEMIRIKSSLVAPSFSIDLPITFSLADPKSATTKDGQISE